MGKSGSSQRSFSVNASDYKLLEEIGNGASATVFRAIYVPFNEIVAIKCLDLDRCNSNLDDIRKEAQMMSLIDHPNLVKAYCSFVVERNLWVVMPFMAEGSCLHLMKIAYPDGFEEPAICSILKETLKALVYLHAHGHIHRDVKAGNILLDTKGVVKLADFGVSACMFDSGDRQRSRNTFVGTPCWMAPEVLQPGSGYNFKADIWSFGITALELAHGHAPFSKYPPMKVLLMTIQNAPPGLDYDRDKKFSKSFKEMVAMCLVKDQSKRPTAEKLLKHSFFKHAKSPEHSVKKLLAELPPLGDRVKALQLKDASQLALKRMPSAEQEAISLNEYKRGVSGWNFDIEDLKAQAALVQDDNDLAEIKEVDESIRSASSSKDLSDIGSVSGKHFAPTENVCREQGNIDEIAVIQTQGNIELAPTERDIYTGQIKPNAQSGKGRQSQSGPLMPEIVLGQTSTEKRHVTERSENDNQISTEKTNRISLKSPCFSGPLMLPTQASANSLSAPTKSSGCKDFLDEKSKANLVQIKGRFSVTSDSLDAVKITSQPTKDMNSANVTASLLLPHLQNLLQQTTIQQDVITSFLNSLQSYEVDGEGLHNGKVPMENGSVEIVASERQQLLLNKISDLQRRMAHLTEELNAERQRYVPLQKQSNVLLSREEDEDKTKTVT